jgi:uncharacterized damage-inducible protein DinB
MTNKEFYVKILQDERPRFRRVIEALPEDMHSHKVHDKSREAGNLASQLTVQWYGTSGIVKNGVVAMDAFSSESKPTKGEMLDTFDKNYDQLLVDMAEISDDEWENGEASLGEMWKDKKYMMAWSFLFDAIHHRGQLTTYLRNMGANVPAVYGPSADAQF